VTGAAHAVEVLKLWINLKSSNTAVRCEGGKWWTTQSVDFKRKMKELYMTNALCAASKRRSGERANSDQV
jgi:hypothetical protein